MIEIHMHIYHISIFHDFIRPVGHEEQGRPAVSFSITTISESEEELEEELVEYTWISTINGLV